MKAYLYLIYEIYFSFSSSFLQTHFFFAYFVESVLLFLDDNVNEECEKFSKSQSVLLSICLGFFADFSLALLLKVLLITKKRVLTFFKNFPSQFSRDTKLLKYFACNFLCTGDSVKRYQHHG